MKVSELRAPRELVVAWERDLEDLTPVQEAAVRAGILDGRDNLLVVAPTSSGKTLVGEMAAAQIAMVGKKHVFVAVPMKSLAEEHFFRLQDRYREEWKASLSDIPNSVTKVVHALSLVLARTVNKMNREFVEANLNEFDRALEPLAAKHYDASS